MGRFAVNEHSTRGVQQFYTLVKTVDDTHALRHIQVALIVFHLCPYIKDVWIGSCLEFVQIYLPGQLTDSGCVVDRFAATEA